MVPELEKPRVTEIQVRMDCNGCVQKIKKALNGINGIYDLCIDSSQQKITIIGWADPEKIVKALRKTRKRATICSHTEATDPAAQPTEGGAPPAPEGENPPPPEAPPAETTPPTEPPNNPENPQPETPQPPPEATSAGQPPSGPKDVQEVHLVYYHPPDYGHRYDYSHRYGGQWNNYHNVQGFQSEPPQPIRVTHSYNAYQPSPYVTEYEYIRSPPRYVHHSRMDRYDDDYRVSASRNGNITSIFSDENPNACRIV